MLSTSANWTKWIDIEIFPQFNFEGPAAVMNPAAEYMECLQKDVPQDVWVPEVRAARGARCASSFGREDIF